MAWSRVVSWPTGDQVEQDLLLSRLIVEIANDEYLGGELIFRGGTCLHKLWLPSPWRCSEDPDYVRRSAGGIADLRRALTRVGEKLDMEVRTRIGQYPKVFLRAPFESGSGPMKIKVEVNTFERLPARSPEAVPFAVTSSWFSGSAMVATFTAAEMLATKIRALFQRSKGRDLFDLWLGLTVMQVHPSEILNCFAPDRPEGFTTRRAILNLEAKLDDAAFRRDLDPLVATWPDGYSVQTAGELIIETVQQAVRQHSAPAQPVRRAVYVRALTVVHDALKETCRYCSQRQLRRTRATSSRVTSNAGMPKRSTSTSTCPAAL